MLTLALSSGVWAVDPKPEITMLFALLGTTAFGVYLASRFSLEELFRNNLFSAISRLYFCLMPLLFYFRIMELWMLSMLEHGEGFLLTKMLLASPWCFAYL